MSFGWFNARQAAEVGAALADQFAPPTASHSLTRGKKNPAQREGAAGLPELLRRAERETRALGLNFFKKATFANSFKWKLLENGVERERADEVTRSLVLHISRSQADSVPGRDSAAGPTDRAGSSRTQHLAQGNEYLAQRAYAKAIASYERLLELDSRHPEALNNIGAAFCKLSRYPEAEQHFRRAVGLKPKYADAHGNLGTVLRWRGHLAGAENSLRRAVRLKPNHLDARSSLGLTLLTLGRPIDAKAEFEKVLRIAPRHAEALVGMAHVARAEGRFAEAEALLKRVLEADPNMPVAWAALVGLRKMTPDGAWLQRAQDIAASGIAPLDEAGLRFAMGKYYDDVADFEPAFRSYQRGNELLKPIIAEKYEP